MDSGLTAVIFATTDKGVIPETSRLKPSFALLNKYVLDKRSTQSALLSLFIYLFIYLFKIFRRPYENIFWAKNCRVRV